MTVRVVYGREADVPATNGFEGIAWEPAERCVYCKAEFWSETRQQRRQRIRDHRAVCPSADLRR